MRVWRSAAIIAYVVTGGCAGDPAARRDPLPAEVCGPSWLDSQNFGAPIVEQLDFTGNSPTLPGPTAHERAMVVHGRGCAGKEPSSNPG